MLLARVWRKKPLYRQPLMACCPQKPAKFMFYSFQGVLTSRLQLNQFSFEHLPV